MRKISVVGLALMAVCMFGVMVVSSASAALAEFLDNGAAITATENVLTELMQEAGVGILLEDMGNSTEVECMKGDDEGTVGPNGVATTTEALCTEALPATGLCSAPVVITALNLPWTTTIELVGTTFRGLVTNAGENVGYEVECNTIIGLIKDKCIQNKVPLSGLIENDGATGTILVLSDATTETESEKSTCSVSGMPGLVLAGSDILILNENGLVYTVSE